MANHRARGRGWQPGTPRAAGPICPTAQIPEAQRATQLQRLGLAQPVPRASGSRAAGTGRGSRLQWDRGRKKRTETKRKGDYAFRSAQNCPPTTQNRRNSSHCSCAHSPELGAVMGTPMQVKAPWPGDAEGGYNIANRTNNKVAPDPSSRSAPGPAAAPAPGKAASLRSGRMGNAYLPAQVTPAD